MSLHSSHSSASSFVNDKEDTGGGFHKLVADQREFFLSGKPAQLEHRIEQLKKLRAIIEAESDALCNAVYKDLHRSPSITFLFEIATLLGELSYFIDNIKEWSKPVVAERTLVTMLDTPLLMKQPKGVVLVIGPWNFPVTTLLGPLIAVIAAGNTAIVKPSEVAKHTSEVVGRILSAQFDPRYLAVVQGGITETTELLKENFDHIMYTGCTTVGHIVMSAAAKHLTTVTLELGGKSPTIVMPDVDVEVTARRIIWGKLMNCGQTCISPDYVLTTPAMKPKLVAALIDTLHSFYGKDPQSSDDYSRIINRRHYDRLISVLERSKAEVLYRGGTFDPDDLFIPPHILDVDGDDPIMKDEIFGPILPIVTVANLTEAIDFINARDTPLALYLFTRDEAVVSEILQRTRSGGVTVNDVIMHATVDSLPFGGVGKSGMGAYHGRFGFDEFSHTKPVLKKGFFLDVLAAGRYPPLTKEKVAQMKKFLSVRTLLPRWFSNFCCEKLPLIALGVLIGCLSSRYLSGGGFGSLESPVYSYFSKH